MSKTKHVSRMHIWINIKKPKDVVSVEIRVVFVGAGGLWLGWGPMKGLFWAVGKFYVLSLLWLPGQMCVDESV